MRCGKSLFPLVPSLLGESSGQILKLRVQGRGLSGGTVGAPLHAARILWLDVGNGDLQMVVRRVLFCLDWGFGQARGEVQRNIRACRLGSCTPRVTPG